MKRSKNQAVFKFVPGMWISSNLPSGEPITAQLTVWNPTPVHDIFDSFINIHHNTPRIFHIIQAPD